MRLCRSAVFGLSFGLAACSPDHSVVQFRPGTTGPIPPILTAEPIDVAPILDSLARAAPRPPPDPGSLIDSLRGYTPPDPTAAREIHDRWLAARTSVQRISDSLYRIADRTSQAYRSLYQRFRTRYDDLVAREARLERALREISADEVAIARRAIAAADDLRAWEDLAYAPFDSLAHARAEASGREGVTVHVSPDHPTTLILPAGRWWLTGRIRHPTNPFFEYLWRVPFVSNPLTPVFVPLTDRHVTLQWRH